MYKKFIYFIVLIVFSSHMWAGTARGKITSIIVRDSDGLVYVNVEGRANKPDCAVGNYMIIKNENSATGKRQLALLLMAQAANKVISVTGYGTCTRWPDGEDINYILVEK
ncbi:hypothetical protein KTH87_01375 [Acinetobacter baumannii]|uniref:hypothetical protein n=1 Tax=Acinetobacter baumannii TaxID=470 RepID=UPI000281846B|nr:hypothetical protein [Acinetobacter baumannii]EKB36472.1 hypothetical protein W9K_01725 [Acinetobacter baumannii Ab33333]MCT9291419.1 hypothetical protein [Acinetobacter baumannii]MDC4307261.1 hypothetical protein [Acinetobacter baumannii]MDN8179512.1 hypothetical protein [Acinetobacter baumannii]